MKKKTMAALIIGSALMLGGVSVYAANQIARSSAISEELAWNFAFVDAGVMPEEANVIKTEFDFEKGRFVYEIEFIANGVKYEYVVDSSDGSILERESEALPGAQIKPTQAAENTPANTQQATENKLISIDDAKRIALEQAGLTAADVTFKKTKIEREDGLQVYAVEFYVPGKMKYEYTIDAITGAILEESLEVWEADDYVEYGTSQGGVAQTDESGAGGGQSGGSGSSGQGGGTVPGGQGSGGSSSGQSSGGSSGGSGSTGSGQGSGTTAQPTPAPSQPTATPAPTPAPTAPPAPTVQDIGVERAKSIALSHAGVSASNVVFEKVKQDWEDGVLVYEVEFYVPGYAEYDYEIDAATGAIRDYDIDFDD